MTRHLREATSAERAEFAECVEMLAFSLPYRVTPVRAVCLYWDDRMNTANGVLGSYSILHPERVCLAAHGRRMKELLVPVLCRELHHHWQYHTFGLLYVLACVPGLREITIERTADAVEDAACTAMGMSL